jgi:Integrase core domain
MRGLWSRHIYCSPYHPQTNGKLERLHEAQKTRLNLLVYTNSEALQEAMAEFIEFYNHRHYHEEISNVTPGDVYYGRREEILNRRKEQKQATLESRFQYNLGLSQTKPGVNGGVNCSFEISKASLAVSEDAPSKIMGRRKRLGHTIWCPL